MRLADFIVLRDEGNLVDSPEWAEADAEIREAIEAVVWPPGATTFTVNNEVVHGNGVAVVKDAFIEVLTHRGWKHERRAIVDGIRPGPIDALKDFPNGETIVCEWETGNVASSHRALNKIVMALQEDNILGGVLVVPDRHLYRWMTDRIGNLPELEPYFPVWQQTNLGGEGLVGIYVVTYDAVSPDVPRMVKGTDGRALR